MIKRLCVSLFRLSRLPSVTLDGERNCGSSSPQCRTIVGCIQAVLLPSVLQGENLFSGRRGERGGRHGLGRRGGARTGFERTISAFEGVIDRGTTRDVKQLTPSSSERAVRRVVSSTVGGGTGTLKLGAMISSRGGGVLVDRTSGSGTLTSLVCSFLMFGGVPPRSVLCADYSSRVDHVPRKATSVCGCLQSFFIRDCSGRGVFIVFIADSGAPDT